MTTLVSHYSSELQLRHHGTPPAPSESRHKSLPFFCFSARELRVGDHTQGSRLYLGTYRAEPGQVPWSI